MKNRKRRNDIILAAGLIAAASVAALVMYLAAKPGDYALVTVGGKEWGKYPLDRDAEVVITTEYGENRLVIKDGVAFVTEADCPDKLCVRQHSVKNGGEAIVCLPNKMTVRIVSDKDIVDIAG